MLLTESNKDGRLIMKRPRSLSFSLSVVAWLLIFAVSGCVSQGNPAAQPEATSPGTPLPQLSVTPENLQFYDFQFTPLNPNDSRLEKVISQDQAVSAALQFEARGQKATFVTTQVGFSDGATLLDLANERLVWLVTFHGVDSPSSGPPESTHQVSHELTVVVDAHTGERIVSFTMGARPPEPDRTPTSTQIAALTSPDPATLTPSVIPQAWTAVRAALPSDIPVYMPTDMPARFGPPQLEEVVAVDQEYGPHYTIIYYLPTTKETVAFILNIGKGAWGNAPPPESTEPITVDGASGALEYSSPQGNGALPEYVAWWKQDGQLYQIKALSPQITKEEIQQIIASLVPLKP
jgi:hypothetical protein